MASPLRFQRGSAPTKRRQAQVSFRQHAEPHSRLHGWFWTYQISTPGLRLGIEPTIRLDLDNEPQPDIVLIFDEAVGGKAKCTDDGYLEGVRELVVEIVIMQLVCAASSAAIDTGSKKQAYRRNGILEYIVWQSFENQLDWFCLIDGEYRLLPVNEDGIIRSRVFPGLWLASALLTGDLPEVLRVLQQGLNSTEHAVFVKRLNENSP